MQRINGALREHVLELSQACAAPGGDTDGPGVDVNSEAGGQCWKEPFMVDIRYDTSSDLVCTNYSTDIKRAMLW